MSTNKIYVFAKEGLSQNLIHLALAESYSSFAFYHHLAELTQLTLTQADVVIVDDSIFNEPQDIQVWVEKLKGQRCIFLLGGVEFKNVMKTVGNVLSKPFAPQDLRALI